jgi:hypothetical protein
MVRLRKAETLEKRWQGPHLIRRMGRPRKAFGPLRLEAQDTALSRRQHRFESGRGRHDFIGFFGTRLMISPY